MKKLLMLFVMISSFISAQNKKVFSSDVRWKAYKTLKTDSFSHYGTIGLKSGVLVMKNNEIAGGIFLLDMKRIDAEDMKGKEIGKKMLEDHLRDGDFFDVKKYPYSTFKITSVKKNNDKIYNYIVAGILTIKGVSKPLSFPVKVTQANNVVNVVSANFQFNRQDFGLKYNVFEDMVIKNNVDMQVKISAK